MKSVNAHLKLDAPHNLIECGGSTGLQDLGVRMSELILGLHGSMNAFSHDSSACLIQSGRIIAATEEERISRNKVSLGYFPRGAIQACLSLGAGQAVNVR
jgi:hypothetical protein